jgi:integrase
MKTTASRKPEQEESWPQVVTVGNGEVRIYKRKTPTGNDNFMLSYWEDGKRKMPCFKERGDAFGKADEIARKLDGKVVAARNITHAEAVAYFASADRLKPFGVTVDAATAVIVECLKVNPDLSVVVPALKFYAARNRQTTKLTVTKLVEEFLKIKVSRGASERYRLDLKGRLEKFSEDCKKDACNVTTADIQSWLDGLKLKPQNYRNYRTVLHTLFRFAVARSYAADNPVEGVERVKVNGGDIEVFTPDEIARLLEAAREVAPDFLPSVAIGAFAGLRSAEIERLEWSDIHLAEKFIVVGASKSKTASRRIVPIHDNLAAWLADYSAREGKIWQGTSHVFHKRQKDIAAATRVEADEANGIKARKPVKWKGNGLRHSYASYRFAQIGDAGRVAGELGNSAVVVHRHYRELVKPADAVKWFNIRPEAPANVVTIGAANFASKN